MTMPEREVAEPVIPSKGYVLALGYVAVPTDAELELVIGPYPTDPEDRHQWRDEAADGI